MTSGDVVMIHGLVKRYRRVEAVRGIDLRIPAGLVFGLLGPNGAGKSTTIRCLLGLLRPTAGSVELFGLDAWREGVAARRRVAYVPGELRLPGRVTGAELVDTVAQVRGAAGSGRSAEIAERLHLDLSRRVRDLSTGNRRKVALVLAFAADADLLILDEPTNGLDPLMQREFLSLVAEAKDRGATVLLSSHVLAEVQRAADRVAVLKEGRIIAEGSVEDLRRQARQRLEVWFDDEPPLGELAGLEGLAQIEASGRRVTATLSGPVQPLLAVLDRSRVSSLLLEEPGLEEAFLDLYGEPAA